MHPLGLVLKAGAWYLIAAVDGKPRTYRISSILKLRTLDARAVRPAKFDLARYWTESLQRFETELYKERATVLASPRGIKLLSNLGSAVATAIAATPLKKLKDGRVRIVIPYESVEDATPLLLPLAPDVEVVEPEALKRALVHRLQEISSCYSQPPGD